MWIRQTQARRRTGSAGIPSVSRLFREGAPPNSCGPSAAPQSLFAAAAANAESHPIVADKRVCFF